MVLSFYQLFNRRHTEKNKEQEKESKTECCTFTPMDGIIFSLGSLSATCWNIGFSSNGLQDLGILPHGWSIPNVLKTKPVGLLDQNKLVRLHLTDSPSELSMKHFSHE